MPELPEVETIARGVDRRVCEDTITDVWFSSHSEPFNTPPSNQAKGLKGRRILSVHRTGKHLVCELGEPFPPDTLPPNDSLASAARSSCAQWIVHLGMTGRLLVTTPESTPPTHTHMRLMLASGRELRFVDPRRFGRLEFRDLSQQQGFQAAGLDPLQIAQPEFFALFRHRKLSIKAALLNQHLLSGVGNIYADESLFAAEIRPTQAAGRLNQARLDRLRIALKSTLEHAIEKGGSSVSDYVDADGVRGFFQLDHCVYLRTGKPCRRCGTPIKRIELGGRGTHFCPKCQR